MILLIVITVLVYLLVKKITSEPRKVTDSTHETFLPTAEQTRNLILNRRSIFPKQFNSNEKLSSKELDLILEASNWAPTHAKNEPWRYSIIEGPDKITNFLDFMENWYESHSEEILEEDLKRFKRKLYNVRNGWPYKVSHLLLIGMKRQAKEQRLPEWEEISAVAMSVQNMHLMTTTLDRVGGYWSSLNWCRLARDSGELKQTYFGELLDDPEDRIFGAFVLGKYAEGKTFRSVRSDIQLKCNKIGSL